MCHPTAFSNAIAHLDCNSFFASVEQAYNPALKGRPVLVGGMGGGCVIAASKEAKERGVGMGTPVFEARKLLPDAVFVPGDFKKYQNYNQKFLGILSTFGATIEAASIDECYLDLKGLRRLFRKSYVDICHQMRESIKNQLGITVSIGLSVSKSLAKLASDFKKPDAVTVVSGPDIEKFLGLVELKDICGIGHNTHALLNKFGIFTPLQFVSAKSELIKKLLGKVGLELQQELRGEAVHPVTAEVKAPKSLARTRSFKVSENRDFIYSEMHKNLEMAFWELRRQNLKTKKVAIMLRTKDYHIHCSEIEIGEYINCQSAIQKELQISFDKVYRQGVAYRSTGLLTFDLKKTAFIQPTLFESEIERSETISLFSGIDKINAKYGGQTISFAVNAKNQHKLLRLENLITPFLGEVR